MVSVCQTKSTYRTKEIAQFYADKFTEKYGDKMELYKCRFSTDNNPHFHITHADHEQRRGLGHAYILCPWCGETMLRVNENTHVCVVEEGYVATEKTW